MSITKNLIKLFVVGVLFFMVVKMLSGCDLFEEEVVEAEEHIPPGYTINCDDESTNCIQGEPALQVTANGQVIGVINEKEEFVFNKYFNSISLHNNGRISNNYIYFQNGNCTEEPYAEYAENLSYNFFIIPLQGDIYDWNQNLYYYPAGINTFYRFIAASRYKYHPTTEGTCQNLNTSPDNLFYIKLYLNNPSVTGIQTYPFPSPVEILNPNPITIIVSE